MQCEVCQDPATHCCSGLDVPMLHFCEEHAAEHRKQCPAVLRGTGRVERMGGECKTPEQNIQITTRDYNRRDELRWNLGLAFLLAPEHSRVEELLRQALAESFGSDERAAEYLESTDFGVVPESEEES